MGCPDENALNDLLAGALSAVVADDVRAHAESCGACRAVMIAVVREAVPSDLAEAELASEGIEALDLDDGAFAGRYVPESVLGAGAMGLVYAGHDVLLERTVAIKVRIRSDGDVAGSGSSEGSADAAAEQRALSRVQREARSLAQLNHPNVATVYDVGSHGGQLFIAMELVRGDTLRTWAAAEPQRPWTRVVDAYVQAARGLAAAHAAGIVHRDFKPDNAMIDPQGRVRVMDFGLASIREVTPDGVTSTLAGRRSGTDVTRTRGGAGTPAYMAPECLSGAAANPASDQFSLCVSLWEALYGLPPFAGKTVAAIIDSIENRRLQVAPGAPVPDRIRRALARGLSLRPERRWPTLDSLCTALGDASRPRSRRALVSGATLLGVGASAWIAWPAEPASPCDGGQSVLAEVWSRSQQADVRRSILDLGGPSADRAWDRIDDKVTAYGSQWTEISRQACEDSASGAPEAAALWDLKARCLHRAKVSLRAATRTLASADAETVARADGVLDGLPTLARCEDVEALHAEVEAPPPEEAEAVEQIGVALVDAMAALRAGKLEHAQARVRQAEERGATLQYEPVQTRIMQISANVSAAQGDYEQAAESARKALDLATQWGQRDDQSAAAMSLLGLIGYYQASTDEAMRYRSLALQLSEDNPIRHSKVQETLAQIDLRDGKYEDAERALRGILAFRIERLGAEHRLVASSHDNLANALLRQGKLEEAERESRKGLELRIAEFGETHPLVAISRANLASIFESQGRCVEAEKENRRALAMRERLLGPTHPDVGTSYNNLAVSLKGQGKAAPAEEAYRKALAIRKQALRVDHRDIALLQINLATVIFLQGRHAEAVAQNREALTALERELGPDHPHVALCLNNFGRMLLFMGEHEEAEPVLREAIAKRERSGHSESALHAITRGNLGELLIKAQRFSEARVELLDAVEILERRVGPAHRDTAWTRTMLAEAYLREGNREKALQLAERTWPTRETMETQARAQLAYVLVRATWPTPPRGEQQRDRARGLASMAIADYEAVEDSTATAVRAWLDEALADPR